MAVTAIIKKTLESFGTTANNAVATAATANNAVTTAATANNAIADTTPLPPPTMSQFFILTIVIMLWFLLTIMVSKYLWNECLCKVLTICKPTDDLFVIFGIIILFDILRPRF